MATGQFVVEAVLTQGRSVSEVARTHGISRRWVTELLRRYREGGIEALEPKSKRAHSFPNQTSLDIEDEIIFIRKTLSDDGYDAGPHTIHHHLQKKFETVPSVATIWRILKRRGFVEPQPQKRPKSSYIRFEAELPNQTWQSDFTHWQLADGTDVKILNFLDDHSRFALASVVLLNVRATDIVEVFHKAAKTHGYPESVLTDNGRVYTTSQYGTKVLMEQELDRLGIKYKHGRPYHPETQGKIERWHQTLKIYLAKKPPAATLEQLQKQVDDFVSYYNEIRPHRSLGKLTPRQAYEAKNKAHPTKEIKTSSFRVRRDKVGYEGKVTLRYRSKLHHIYVGKAHKYQSILMLIDDLDIRVVTAEGELLHHFTLDPTRDYQPMNGGRDKPVKS